MTEPSERPDRPAEVAADAAGRRRGGGRRGRAPDEAEAARRPTEPGGVAPPDEPAWPADAAARTDAGPRRRREPMRPTARTPRPRAEPARTIAARPSGGDTAPDGSVGRHGADRLDRPPARPHPPADGLAPASRAPSWRRRAARDELDRSGLLDLAEARWRTGDLAAAGEAAEAAIRRGASSDPLAFVIAAEAVAALGPARRRRGGSRVAPWTPRPARSRRCSPACRAAPSGPHDAAPSTSAARRRAHAGAGASPGSAPSHDAPARPRRAAAAAFAGGRGRRSLGGRRAPTRRAPAGRGDPPRARVRVGRSWPRSATGPSSPPSRSSPATRSALLGRETEALAAFDIAATANRAARLRRCRPPSTPRRTPERRPRRRRA